MMKLNATTIADDLAVFLGNFGNQSVRVHSVFTHALNLLVGADELITLVDYDDVTLMGLVVDEEIDFTNLVSIGDEVVIDSSRFFSADGALMINLAGARVWQSAPLQGASMRDNAEIAQVREQLSGWLEKQPSMGLLPLMPRLVNQQYLLNQPYEDIYCRFIANDLHAFNTAILEDNWQTALKQTEKLIGFGMGSTPSCDDFLAAYLAVFSYTDQLLPDRYPWIKQFNQAVSNRAISSTTTISLNMLRHAAFGKLDKSSKQLVETCLFIIKEDLFTTAARVLEHGASSGGDFLLGLVCVLEWFQQQETALTKEGAYAFTNNY